MCVREGMTTVWEGDLEIREGALRVIDKGYEGLGMT